MIGRVRKLLRMGEAHRDDGGLLFASGPTVPTAATAGYRTGCIFQHTDGTAGTALYINEGSVTSCTFAAVAALAAMAAGTGITAGTGTVCAHSVVKAGTLYKTTIFIDVTGLQGGAAADTIIGVDGSANPCHIGQIVAAVNGTIVYGQITCLETPAGGDPDINFYGSADEGNVAQDAALTALTGEELLLNHGDWTGAAATPVALTALPDAAGYMYMTQGAITDVKYSAGQFLIELWGV